MNRFVFPLLLFAAVAVLLWRGLDLNPREIPSALIDKAAPPFSLKALHNESQTVSLDDMAGKVWLLNVWASWCVACLQEHALITSLSREVDIVGLNYKDKRQDAMAWLKQNGNPYLVSVHDFEGNTGIDYGVYGVPETFIIDQQGQIRYKHIGPVTNEAIGQTLLPIVNTLREVN